MSMMDLVYTLIWRLMHSRAASGYRRYVSRQLWQNSVNMMTEQDHLRALELEEKMDDYLYEQAVLAEKGGK